MSFRFLIIGAGFSGSVLARELVTKLDCQIDIREERDHIAGNCFTSPDDETGIMIHRYGPHIFNTNKEHIWKYFNNITDLRPYVHRVKAYQKGSVFSLPVNLATLNQFFQKTFTPGYAKQFLNSIGDHSIINTENFEQQAIRFLGDDLYKAFFYGYTKKQWGCEPRELPASILKRLPVRFDYNDNYHNSLFTGIPVNGYTDFVEKLLGNRRIKVMLNKKFNSEQEDHLNYDHIFYTGPIDAYFKYELGRLSYRTLHFETEIHDGDFQGCTQINYCDEEVPFTRITEHKHFTPWKTFEKTVIFKEFSKEAALNDTPYYPKRLKTDKDLLKKYRLKAETLPNTSFLGRLGTYRYLDMDDVIEEAINFSETFCSALLGKQKIPSFPNVE